MTAARTARRKAARRGRRASAGDDDASSGSSFLGPAPALDRGRDAGYPAPPAQIRTSPIKAYGSCLGW
jgi:hypothetical protein